MCCGFERLRLVPVIAGQASETGHLDYPRERQVNKGEFLKMKRVTALQEGAQLEHSGMGSVELGNLVRLICFLKGISINTTFLSFI